MFFPDAAVLGAVIAVIVAILWGPRDSDSDGVPNLSEYIQDIDADKNGTVEFTEVAAAAVLPAGLLITSSAVAQGIILLTGFLLMFLQAPLYICRMRSLQRRNPFSIANGSKEHDRKLLEFLQSEYTIIPKQVPDYTTARSPSRSDKQQFAEYFISHFNGMSSIGSFSQAATDMSEWDFDVFCLRDLTTQPLVFTGFICLGALEGGIEYDSAKLLSFLCDLEASYKQVPYHSSMHGAAVARWGYVLLQESGLGLRLPCLMRFTLVLAGLCHDVGHPGVNASFLLRQGDELSMKYNDQSPLENMHSSMTWELLQREKNSFLSPTMLASIRSALVRAILGTDMAMHAQTLTRLDMLIDNLEHGGSGASGVFIPWYWPMKPPPGLSREQRDKWERSMQEEFVLEVFLHAADIGTPSMPFEQFMRWNALVQQEFHEQGDRELSEFGELISLPAGFDRNASTAAVHGFTVFFMRSLCLNHFEAIHRLTRVNSLDNVAHKVDIQSRLAQLRKNIQVCEDSVPKDKQEGE